MQTAQAVLYVRAHVLDDLVVIAIDRFLGFVNDMSELGGDDHLIAFAFKRIAQNFFAVPCAIVRGGIEEVDTQLQRRMDRTRGFGIVDSAPACWEGWVARLIPRPRTADRPASHAECAHFQLTFAQCSF